jgi:hypothetical protein
MNYRILCHFICCLWRIQNSKTLLSGLHEIKDCSLVIKKVDYKNKRVDKGELYWENKKLLRVIELFNNYFLSTSPRSGEFKYTLTRVNVV